MTCLKVNTSLLAAAFMAISKEFSTDIATGNLLALLQQQFVIGQGEHGIANKRIIYTFVFIATTK